MYFYDLQGVALLIKNELFLSYEKRATIAYKKNVAFQPRFRIRLRCETKLFNKNKSSRTIFEDVNKVQRIPMKNISR